MVLPPDADTVFSGPPQTPETPVTLTLTAQPALSVPPTTQRRVVLVDDQTLIIEAFSLLLNALPDVDLRLATTDPDEALAFVRDHEVEVALVDYSLSDTTDGVNVTEQLRALSPTTRVLIVTSFAGPELAANAVRAGAAGILSKDVSARELHEAIATVAAGGHVQDPKLLAATLDALARPAHARLLTDREREILTSIAQGNTNGGAAEELGISPKTVATHMERMMRKLGVRTRGAAISRAARLGEIDLPE